METTQLRIGYTDVILQDYGLSKGKLIISDDNYGYHFGYYWGAMGETNNLSKFLQKLNPGYFVGKLSPFTKGDIDVKKTMKAVRDWWKNESGIKWYQYLELQKELRTEFKNIEETCSSEENFVNKINDIDKNINTLLFDFKGEYKDFKSAIKGLQSEPWWFIEHEEHPQNKFLRLFLPKLQAKLKDINP